MTREDFMGYRHKVINTEASELLNTKGKDYSANDDHFDNFKRQAEALGLKPEQVWAVYASKHWDAIMSFVRTGALASETIESRLLDLRNYLDLLAAYRSEEEYRK